ncbi:MAG: sulfatase-like hydrolase/transferase [Fuerstiella sp.]|nr:sulfatase-like hydrolase/transferase [Fuerstiella sp.]
MTMSCNRQFTCVCLLFVLCCAESDGIETRPARPNIVFILADDLGWSELGCYGNGFNETPNLDSLADDGLRFTLAYAAAPVCSPYRAALLTGQHPARIGILDYLRPNSANALSTDLVTLPEILRKNGYSTGMIGKWHLTGYDYHEAEYEIRPRDHGFAWNFGSEVKGVGNGANFWPYVFRTQPVSWIDITTNRLGDNEYLTDRLNLEAVDFIERNQKQPFFLYVSHYAPHTILNGRPDLVEKYLKKHKPGKSSRNRCYLCQDHGKSGDALHHWAGDHNPHLAAMLESIDVGVGMIRSKLEELDLGENTIVIFSSDNGGETNVTSNAPLRGGKSQLYEGGIRVPLIVSWPDCTPPGQVCVHPTVNTDFYPTLLDASGSSPDPTHIIDGITTLETWKNPDVAPERETLYWHYPLDRSHFLGGVSSGAVRDGNWKLIEHFDSERTQLYSLADDLSEQKDVSSKHPETVAKLLNKLRVWRDSVNARTPSPPLLTSPKKLYAADHFSSGNASPRWFFNKDWSAQGGVLTGAAEGQDTTRLFLKDAEYSDVMIRFDFRPGESQDIRLVTGSGGYYNAVIHIRPDHFYIQTALDRSGPYFPYRHGECAFNFVPERWYTMTVEFLGDQLVAHIDHDHLAFAQHPVLDKTRKYLAFQVDKHAAEFDNIQVLTATKNERHADNLKLIAKASGAHPVEKTLQDQLAIQKKNAHEWFYQRSPEYVALVKRVDELDQENRRLYPDALQSHKEIRRKISEQRKQLLDNDPRFKELLFSTYRAERQIEAFLLSKKKGGAELPQSRRARELERLRIEFENDPACVALVAAKNEAQVRLEKSYPQLFVSNEQINEARKKRRAALNDDPEFQEKMSERAAAWRAQQNFLTEKNKL